MSQRPVFAFVAAYGADEDARADYDALLALHATGVVGTYDVALISKDVNGKVHVHKHEKPTQHGAWGGAAAGALIGILFPPALIGSAIVGAGAGGAIGHLWRGMSRGEMKDLGATLDDGQAALVVVGESKLEEAVEKAVKRADKQMRKQLAADVGELEKELVEMRG